MKLSHFTLARIGLAIFAGQLTLVIPSYAAETAAKSPQSSDEILFVVANGKITNPATTEKPAVATVRNVVDRLQEIFRDVTITLVGVDDLLIDNVALRLSPKRGVLGPLAALGEATGRRLRVQPFSPTEIMLAAEKAGPRRRADVYNLKPLLVSNQATQLERMLRDEEAERTALQKRFAGSHPKIAEITEKIESIKARLAQVGPPADREKVIDDISRAVFASLKLLNTGEKPPEFEFHAGSNLLIVVGSEDALDVTRKVIDAMEKNNH